DSLPVSPLKAHTAPHTHAGRAAGARAAVRGGGRPAARGRGRRPVPEYGGSDGGAVRLARGAVRPLAAAKRRSARPRVPAAVRGVAAGLRTPDRLPRALGGRLRAGRPPRVRGRLGLGV